MKLCSSYFKIPEAEYASVVLRSGCSGTKPIAHIGFGITFLKPLIIWAGMFFVAAVTSQLLTQQDGKVCTLVPFDLRVEHMTAPLGIDEAFPRFSWKLKSN
ncbi:MAG: hypothetical protein LBJ00_10285, partial [Planctomycetaceae bacterium]|nr:hypothetical protein [Planctomycetaceae bacterium]